MGEPLSLDPRACSKEVESADSSGHLADIFGKTGLSETDVLKLDCAASESLHPTQFLDDLV